MSVAGATLGELVGALLGDTGSSGPLASLVYATRSVILELVQGDLEDDLPVLLVDLSGSPVDISDATQTPVLHWRKPDGTVVDASLTVVDAASGKVGRIWSTGDTDVAGLHRAQVVVQRAAGEQVFPLDGTHFRWIVHALI